MATKQTHVNLGLATASVALVVLVLVLVYRLERMSEQANRGNEDIARANDRIQAIEVLLGFDRSRSKHPEGLSRLSMLEARMSAVESEWEALPAGLLLNVVDLSPFTPTDPGNASNEVKAANASMRALIEKLQAATSKQLSQSGWKNTAGPRLWRRDFPELAPLMTGEREIEGDFSIEVKARQEFIRTETFSPPPAWTFPRMIGTKPGSSGEAQATTSGEESEPEPGK